MRGRKFEISNPKQIRNQKGQIRKGNYSGPAVLRARAWGARVVKIHGDGSHCRSGIGAVADGVDDPTGDRAIVTRHEGIIRAKEMTPVPLVPSEQPR